MLGLNPLLDDGQDIFSGDLGQQSHGSIIFDGSTGQVILPKQTLHPVFHILFGQDHVPFELAFSVLDLLLRRSFAVQAGKLLIDRLDQV